MTRLHFPHRDQHDYDSPEEEAAWAPYAAALRALRVPPRPRDFALSVEMADKLRPASTPARRRALPRLAALVPVAAVLVVAMVLPRMLPASTSAPARQQAAPQVPAASSAFDAGSGAGPAVINVTTNSACTSVSGAAISSANAAATPSRSLATPPVGASVAPTAAPAPMAACPTSPGGH